MARFLVEPQNSPLGLSVVVKTQPRKNLFNRVSCSEAIPVIDQLELIQTLKFKTSGDPVDKFSTAQLKRLVAFTNFYHVESTLLTTNAVGELSESNWQTVALMENF